MKNMRRIDRQMEHQQALMLLERGEYGVLSSMGTDHQPYGIPVNYVYHNGSIYFHCAVEGRKIDNITYNEKVCFTVVGKTQVLPEQFTTNYESVMIDGRAVVIQDLDEKIMGLMKIAEKYSPDYLEEARRTIEQAKDRTLVIRVEIENISGKHRI